MEIINSIWPIIIQIDFYSILFLDIIVYVASDLILLITNISNWMNEYNSGYSVNFQFKQILLKLFLDEDTDGVVPRATYIIIFIKWKITNRFDKFKRNISIENSY